MDLISEFAINIYRPPLAQLRESGAIADVSNPICAVMLLIDFDTEVSMNGIADFIGNNAGLYARETVTALELVGCFSQAATLAKILDLADAAGMRHDAIQEERSGLEEYAVRSFREVHGEKWIVAGTAMHRLCETIDFSEVMERAKIFAERHRADFEKALGP